DLLQLADRLAQKAAEAAEAAALAGLALGLVGRLGSEPDRRLGRAPAAAGECGLGLLLTARAALRSRRLGHYRVSRCRVWWPHQRQYFLNSTRSGEFRFDFCVW